MDEGEARKESVIGVQALVGMYSGCRMPKGSGERPVQELQRPKVLAHISRNWKSNLSNTHLVIDLA